MKPKLHIYACITQTTHMTLFRLRDSDKRDSVLFFDAILFFPECVNDKSVQFQLMH